MFRRAAAAELGLLELLERMGRLEERMAKLEEQVVKLWEAVKTLQEQMVRLQERVVRLEERVARLEEQVVKLWEAVKTLQEQVKNLQEQVVKLWEAVKTLEERIVKLEERVVKLEERMDRFEDKLNALGARWGLVAEESVRASLYRVLREYLGVARVEKWEEYDREGRVFGRPALIEIDVVVRDDTHYLIEVKSSVDHYDVYLFNRKCEFYAERVKPPRLKKLVVTFYADERARKAARELGVEIVQG